MPARAFFFMAASFSALALSSSSPIVAGEILYLFSRRIRKRKGANKRRVYKIDLLRQQGELAFWRGEKVSFVGDTKLEVTLPKFSYHITC